MVALESEGRQESSLNTIVQAFLLVQAFTPALMKRQVLSPIHGAFANAFKDERG